MKIKNWIWLLGLLCFGAMGYIYINQKKVQEKLNIAAKEIETLALERALLLDNCMLCYTYNGVKLPDLVLYDEHSNAFRLSELLTSKYKLIIRVSYLHCSSCVDDLFQNLNAMINKFRTDDVLIIAEYSNLRAFLAFKNNFSLPYPLYWVAEGEECVLSEENMPYACLMNEERVIRNIMIPIKEFPSHSDRYYNIMWNRYFK